MLKLDHPPKPPPALPVAVIKFSGASMAAALPCTVYDGNYCAGCGVFSHTVVENIAIDAVVFGDSTAVTLASVLLAAANGVENMSAD